MFAGKRGRKPLPSDEKRVTLNARVKPATKAAIVKNARIRNLSVGRLLDLVFSVPINLIPR